MSRRRPTRKPAGRPPRRDSEALAALRTARPPAPKLVDAPYHRRCARGR